jgi:hypothetical protein
MTLFLSCGMAYYGIALHTPEFGSSVYMVFFFGALSELPMTIISKLISVLRILIRDPVPFFIPGCGIRDG